MNDIKKCTVTKSHFKGKEGGYYYIYHEDSLGNYIPYYEHFGVKVILSGSYKIKNYSIILCLLICLLILWFILISKWFNNYYFYGFEN